MTAPVPPVGAQGVDVEALVRDLADAVPHASWCHEADRHPEFPCACHSDRVDVAASLLPVVVAHARRVAAEELRAIGRAGLAASPGPSHPVRVPLGYLFARAAALAAADDNEETGRG